MRPEDKAVKMWGKEGNLRATRLMSRFTKKGKSRKDLGDSLVVWGSFKTRNGTTLPPKFQEMGGGSLPFFDRPSLKGSRPKNHPSSHGNPGRTWRDGNRFFGGREEKPLRLKTKPARGTQGAKSMTLLMSSPQKK